MGGDLALFICSCKVGSLIWKHMNTELRTRINDLLPPEVLKEKRYLKGQQGIEEVFRVAREEHPEFSNLLTEARVL